MLFDCMADAAVAVIILTCIFSFFLSFFLILWFMGYRDSLLYHFAFLCSWMVFFSFFFFLCLTSFHCVWFFHCSLNIDVVAVIVMLSSFRRILLHWFECVYALFFFAWRREEHSKMADYALNDSTLHTFLLLSGFFSVFFQIYFNGSK